MARRRLMELDANSLLIFPFYFFIRRDFRLCCLHLTDSSQSQFQLEQPNIEPGKASQHLSNLQYQYLYLLP